MTLEQLETRLGLATTTDGGLLSITAPERPTVVTSPQDRDRGRGIPGITQSIQCGHG